MTAEGEDREHAPTPKRLETAREKGDLPRSADLAGAAAMAGFTLAALSLGTASLAAAGLAGSAFLSRLGGPVTFAEPMAMVLPLWPFVALPALAVVALLVADRSVVFTGEKLVPRLSRIDPVANAGQKFGIEGLAEFARAIAKVGIVGLLLWWFAATRGTGIVASAALEPRLAVAAMLRLSVEFIGIVAVAGAALGLLDRLWQQHRWIVRNRMSRKDLTDETKESEGDPHIRMERRRKGQEVALNRMMSDVPKADVVIVNPTHYAVALKWDRRARMAPVCVAKGTDEVALRIRAAAAAAGVPLHRDPPTARMIHATVRIGEPIRPEHYREVAAAIRFAERMRRRARGMAP